MSYTLVGKISEARIKRVLPDETTVRALEKAKAFCDAINNRGPGSMRLALGGTQEEIVEKLRNEIVFHFAAEKAGALNIIEFRANCTSVTSEGLFWDSFSIMDSHWHDVRSPEEQVK